MKRAKGFLTTMLLAVLTLQGCGSHKPAAESNGAKGRYQREPIREVTQAQLDADSRLIDAIALKESGRYHEAIEAYAKLANDSIPCPAAWYELSNMLLHIGWTDSAMACIDRAIALNGTNTWYLIQKALCADARHDKRGVAQVWERIVELNPNKLEFYYQLSDSWLQAGDIAAAVATLDRVERIVGITEEVSLQKQRLWMAAEKPEKAIKELTSLAAAMPGEKRYQAMMAEAMMAQKKYSKAKQYYDRVLQADPDDEYIHIQLAEYYKQTGKASDADREMRLAMDNPYLNCITKLQVLAQFYTNEEFYGTRSATTYDLVERAVAGCPDTAQYALVYGDVLMRQERYAEAARWIGYSLANDSSRYEVWEGLLVCLTEVPEREADMIDYARRASKLFPMKALPVYLLAVKEVEQHDYESALQRLERNAKWGYKNGYLEAECNALMAECYYRLGRYDKAWAAFDRCLAAEPDNMVALNNYAWYLAEQGIDLQKAERMSRRTIEREPVANNLDTYGWILHLMGRDDEAVGYLRRAVDLNPESETLRRHLNTIESR